MILAGDVGATKILLEVGDSRRPGWKPMLARRYQVDDFPDMGAVLEAFLREWEAVRPARARITAAALGVAGPAQGNRVKMTHRPWLVDGDRLGARLSIGRFTVVNDLVATAHGIESLAPRDFIAIQPGRSIPGAPQVVLGVGTGLGIAYREMGTVPFSKMGTVPISVLPGEGGHVGFSPASAEQAQAWSALFALHGRVEAEDVASGRGIANLYRARTGEVADAAWVSERARSGGDASCRSVLELFAECLGNIAGDHALAVMARGGVYLAGGVLARLAPHFAAQRFREAFCAKGALSASMMRIPVRAIVNERCAVLGAARIAAQAR